MAKKRKKSTYTIGKETELEYARMKEKEGYISYIPPKGNRWNENKDIYNLFDVLSLRSDCIRLSQVKTNFVSPDAIPNIKQWLKENKHILPSNLVVELAVKKKATKRKPVRWVIKEIKAEE